MKQLIVEGQCFVKEQVLLAIISPSISNLTSSDPLEFAHLNNISNSDILPPDQDVIVPVTCSCSGQYYQANASYVSQVVDENYFTIAKNSYQGLTSCSALMRENPYGELDLFQGLKLQVPLRCACPTKQQIVNGTKFLLTYLVTWEDSIPAADLWKLQEHILDKVAGIEEMLKIYPFEELAAATGNFSAQKKLSNSVHRGVLRGKLVAVKKTSTDVAKEIEILSKINHFNLISLYGVCEHDRDVYLVYEFMENGSLNEWLQKVNCPHVQSWNYLIRIALDVANGLHYLHNFAAPAYVHKDINSCNILLNGDLRPRLRISDLQH
ncbi:lysM domain receptor-like kinase 4 [Olea europaea subsp. europaea]|uniref:LysM domain receptor-like kinase 4 n=1 Tax=Olea europaea subsp. europaea TaxID=158383 RepID=A0A8S0TQN4_OLEEU|nr:lysM domain receptor-like kinase 4 [Olea europaea subsp. europaea]